MKQIHDYLMKDDFEYEEQNAFGSTFYKVIAGWGDNYSVHKNRIYYDIRTMLYDHAEGRVCECGKHFFDKTYVHCEECRHKDDMERYKNREEAEIDLVKCPYVYSELWDTYFDWRDWDGFYLRLEDFEIDELKSLTLEDLRLMTCSPTNLDSIDIDDLFERSELPEDYEPNDFPQMELLSKLVADINEVIESTTVGYTLTNKRVSKKELEANEKVFQEAIVEAIKTRDEENVR